MESQDELNLYLFKPLTPEEIKLGQEKVNQLLAYVFGESDTPPKTYVNPVLN